MNWWSRSRLCAFITSLVITLTCMGMLLYAGFLAGTRGYTLPIAVPAASLSPIWLTILTGSSLVIISISAWVVCFSIGMTYGTLAKFSTYFFLPGCTAAIVSGGLLLGGVIDLEQGNLDSWISNATHEEWNAIQYFLGCCGSSPMALPSNSTFSEEMETNNRWAACNATGFESTFESGFVQNAEQGSAYSSLPFCDAPLRETIEMLYFIIGVFCFSVSGMSLITMVTVHCLVSLVQSRGGLKEDLAYPGGLEEEPIVSFDPLVESPESLKLMKEGEEEYNYL